MWHILEVTARICIYISLTVSGAAIAVLLATWAWFRVEGIAWRVRARRRDRRYIRRYLRALAPDPTEPQMHHHGGFDA